MKRLLLIVAVLAQVLCVTAREHYNIRDFGAKGNGKSDNTEAINRAIAHCNEQGGGVVVVPAGRYLSGTIHLKSNVELRLEKDAVLLGIEDPKRYTGYVCRREGFEKYKVAYAEYWNHTFILGVGCKNVAITGDGVIDGQHIYDPEGEAHFRGPH